MKLFLASLLTFIGLQSAQATSLHPCTPRIQAQPTFMTCAEGNLRYSIQINTLMSDRENGLCVGDNYFESHSALIEVSDENGVKQGTLRLFNGEFTYSLDYGRIQFVSPKAQLKLKKCVTPMNGGFSIGN